jgi:hypothetical protein
MAGWSRSKRSRRNIPHIVIERTDYFGDGAHAADAITWSPHRVQNQRAQAQFNRLLDATNLLFEVVRLVR